MSVTFDISIFGLTKLGNKISIGKTHRTIAAAKKLGGKIFYIDPTATGATYHFYDEEGEEIPESSIKVGDEPFAYTVEGTPDKDKYYCFYNALMTSKKWTYYKDGAYVYNSLGTQTGIGQGKNNTAIVMAADEGAYVTPDSGGTETLWYRLKYLNDNNTGECNDWFIGSKDEIEKLRLAVDSEGASLVPSTWFGNNHIWSSSEYSAQYSWYWNYSSQLWNTLSKYGADAMCALRAF